MGADMPPTPPKRFAVALGCACAAALIVSVVVHRSPPTEAADFTTFWHAGRALLARENPYDVINPTGPYPFAIGYLYPLMAAVVVAPFALAPMHVAWTAFSVVNTAVFSYTLTRDGYWRLPLLMSLPMLTAVQLGQWSPLITAAALAPSLGWVAVAKPTIGGAVFLRRPTMRFAVIAAAFVLVTCAAAPWWVTSYLAEVQTGDAVNYHIPLFVLPFGPLLALAAFRWRDPDARLLLAMSCVPQTMLFYDQLPFVLLARTFRQALVLSLASYLPLVVAPFVQGPADDSSAAMMVVMARILVPLYYLPCVAWVLWRGRHE